MNKYSSFLKKENIYNNLLSVSVSFLLFLTTFLIIALWFNIINKPIIPSTSLLSVFRNCENSLNMTNSSNQCIWKYDHYSPSAWELFWYDNITTLQNHVCPTLTQKDQSEKSIQALQYIINLQNTLFHPSSSSSSTLNKADELLSKIYYRRQCSQSSQSDLLVSQSIEPLIGLLRDPLTICTIPNVPVDLQISGDAAIQSKRFFLLGPSAPFHNYQPSTPTIAPWLYQPGAQKILFDVGSSYFNGMDSTTASGSTYGTRWFYEYFRSKSLSFDRIIAFEASQYVPKSYWNQIPDDLMGVLTFINTGVEDSGKFNPWNILKTIAKAEDYVIIKLDIDTPSLENKLCQQIVNDASISSLIDEMFFEMHVTVNEMRGYWGSPPGELKDTYILFRKLRELGIRMHSWP